MGLKEEILGLDDRKVVEVAVPEWGGKLVRISAMSAADRDEYELEHAEQAKTGKRVNVRAGLVARCLVDDNGERVFTQDDVAALGRKSGKALDRLFDAATTVNAISAKEVAAIEKNSEAAPAAG